MSTDIKLGAVGWVRWAWRQLTTMKVALYLLLFLGIGAIPGSVFPQRSQSPMKVNQYFTEHPDLAKWLNRLGMFDVYGSAWFSAIYLLLVISLIGCIVPRSRTHIADLRRPRPAPPTEAWQQEGVALPAAEVAELSRRLRRLRHTAGDNWITIERGTIRESANIVFHTGLLAIILSVGVGATFGYHGQVIVRERTGFSNVVAQYDSFGSGRWFSTSSMTPFNFDLESMTVTYQTEGPQAGSATDYQAAVSYRESADQPVQKATISVNEPLTVGDASLFLVGHGYAPHFKVTDKTGKVVFDDTVVFLPQDKNFTSNGVVKVPDMKPQLGLDAIFAPTGVVTTDRGPHSLFPEMIDPKVYMSAWVGDLGMDNGVPQNIFQLDKTKLKRIGFEEISPGETWQLPGGGAVTLVDVAEFATFNINHDPGQDYALLFAVITIASLSTMLLVRRRQLWLLRQPDGSWRLVVSEMNPERDVDKVTRLLKGTNS